MSEQPDQRLGNYYRARAAVEADAGPWRRGRGAQGEVDCPVCGTPLALRYARSGHNGHVTAACTTPDCIAWME